MARSVPLLFLFLFLSLSLASGQDDTIQLNDSTASASDAVNVTAGENEAVEKGRKPYASLSEAQSALREKILSNYDRGTMPPYFSNEVDDENQTEQANVSEPITVEIGINFHRVLDVDVVKSEVSLLTWMRFVWTDTRLSWDPEEYNGLDTVWFWVEGGSGMAETSEIWTPDIELWNQKESILTSFSNSFAVVGPDGRVFWSRPGQLNPICKFKGLQNFPFDELVCDIEMGSWSYSGKYMRLKLFEDTGYSVGGSGTSGEAFSEFTLSNVSAKLIIYPPYPTDPLADWPVVMYSVSFERSWEPYIRGYLVSQLIFNIIGFACFWMPIPSGERLALAITAMLAAVAADLVVVSKLPSASELTWMQKFSIVSQVFAAYCVIEGVVVSYFFYQTAENLVPAYLAAIFTRLKKSKKRWSFKNSKRDNQPIGSSRDHLQRSIDISTSGSSLDNDDSGTRRSALSMPSMRPRDADDFQSRKEIKNNTRWKKWAQGVDDFSRLVVPPCYIVIISVFLDEVTKNIF